MFYAYIHARSDTMNAHGIFYVGKGSGSRSGRFVMSCGRNKWHNNIAKKYGYENILVGRLECSNENIAFELEKGLIRCLRGMGVALTNRTDGGEGMSGYRYSEVSKAKMRESRKNVVFSVAYRKNLSDAQLARYQDPAARLAVAARSRIMHLNNPALRKEHSVRMQSKHAENPDWGKKSASAMQAALKKTGYAHCRTEQARSENSKRVKEAWKDPKKRETLLAGLKSEERRRKISEARKREWALRKELGLSKKDKLPKSLDKPFKE